MNVEVVDGIATSTVSGDRGFTLIEVMLSIVVLAVGLVSIVGISGYVSRANTVSNDLSILATAAQDEVDRLRTATWSLSTEDPALAVGGSLTADVADHFSTRTGSPIGDLKVRWVVSEGPGTTGDVRTITILVVETIPSPLMGDGFKVTTAINRE
jgi:prepilin-type N-terminal cleavage/methylation domain-containing protein